MPVIINDFDVVVDPPPESQRDATPAERPAPPEPPRSPLDLADLLDRQHERRLRLRAH